MAEERTTSRPRFEPPQLWDDQAFRKRLTALARKKGVSVKTAMTEIGLTIDFAYRSADSRSTNLLMVVADYFQTSPAELAGWSSAAAPPGDEQLVTRLAEIFSQQTLKMLFITLAITRPDLDPQSIASLASVARYDWDGLKTDDQSGKGK